jgi:hypothetical protein
MRKRRGGLEGAPAALAMGAALAAGLAAVWIVLKSLASWANMSEGESAVLITVALVLTLVSFPVWFSLAIFYGIYIAAYLRRPRARRALSKMADRIGGRAGTVVREDWGGDGAIAGSFRLSILAVLPGTPDQVVQELVRRSCDGGYGEPMDPRTPRVPVPGVPRWRVDVLSLEKVEDLRVPVTPGSTAVWVTLTEQR